MNKFERKYLEMLYTLYRSFDNNNYSFSSQAEAELYNSWFAYLKSDGLVGRCPTLHEVGVALEKFADEETDTSVIK